MTSWTSISRSRRNSKSGIRNGAFRESFNLGLAPERIHAIKRSVDHMLLVFPFEKAIYMRPAFFHLYRVTMAEGIPMKPAYTWSKAKSGAGLEDRCCPRILLYEMVERRYSLKPPA